MKAKNKKIAKWTVITLAALLALWWLFSPAGGKEQTAPQPGAGKAETQAQAGKKRKIKYWVSSMDPSQRSSKPGKDSMGMDMVPVYEGEGSAEGVVKIDPVTIQDIGVRTASVTKGPLTAEIRTVGSVTYNEEKVQHIHTKVSGWVEQLYVDTTGQDVRKGQKLLTIYSPDLVETQEEYLQALKYAKETDGSRFKDVAGGGKALIEAARRRLLLMDIRPGQIEALEKRGKVQNTMALYSPINGIVIDKKVLAGMMVTPGTELYELADLANVWIMGSIYEYELPFVKVGQEAQISLSYEPGVVYKGRISFIYPYLSAGTRTAQVRIDFRNPGLKLKPDMYVNVYIKSRLPKDVLQVPSDAVIRTGTRNIVITALGGGRFLPKYVELGPEGQGMVEIKAGLREGETVVTSGQFLIDSESNMKEAVTRMEGSTPENGAGGVSNVIAGGKNPGVTAGTKPAGRKQTSPAQTRLNNITLGGDQRHLMSGIIGAYMEIHKALASGSISGVTSNAKTLSGLVYKLRQTDPGGKLEDLTAPMTQSVQGLRSGDLKKAKDAFVPLSRALVAYVKGPGRSEAHAAGVKIFYCSMKKESWLQKGEAPENPFLKKGMQSCGNKVNY